MGRYKKLVLIFLISIIVIFLLYQIAIIWGYLVSNQPNGEITDYFFFYYAFDNVWEGKDSSLLYNCDFLQQTAINDYKFEPLLSNQCFLYPPQFAVLLSWFGMFSYVKGAIIWNICLSILFMIGIILFARVIYPKAKPPWYFWMGTLLLALSNIPHIMDFSVFNSNRLIFFLISLMLYFLYYKKMPFIAGVFLGAATIFKITPMIMLVFYLLQKRWRVVYGFLASTFIGTLFTMMIVGWNTVWSFVIKDFWSLSNRITVKYGSPTNNSIYGVIKGNMPNLSPQWFYIGFVITMFFIYLFLLRRKKGDMQEIILITMSSLIFTIHLERTHMIMAFFAEMILLYDLIAIKNVSNIRFSFLILYILSIFIFLALLPVNVEYFIVLIALFLSSFFPDFNSEELVRS